MNDSNWTRKKCYVSNQAQKNYYFETHLSHLYFRWTYPIYLKLIQATSNSIHCSRYIWFSLFWVKVSKTFFQTFLFSPFTFSIVSWINLIFGSICMHLHVPQFFCNLGVIIASWHYLFIEFKIINYLLKIRNIFLKLFSVLWVKNFCTKNMKKSLYFW